MAPKFSLQNVLDVHHSRVEGFEVELSRLLSFKLEAEGLLQKFQQSRQETMIRLAEAQVGDLDLFAISALNANIQNIEKQIKTIENEIAKLETAITNKQQELLAARQDEEVLQILKRKRIDLFTSEQNLREARAQDDIYISQAFRQRQEGI